MPTGYTAEIQKGITFKQFALTCARAFGACIEMRDDPFDAPIPDKFEPSDYDVKALKKAEDELRLYSKMSPEYAQTLATEDYRKEVARLKKALKDVKEIIRKYQDMLDQVREWVPPTAEHIGMKDFMIEQIESSIKFDGMEDYYEKALVELKPLSGKQWVTNRIEDAIRDIKYHSKELEEEKRRAEERTSWIKALRESLT